MSSHTQTTERSYDWLASGSEAQMRAKVVMKVKAIERARERVKEKEDLLRDLLEQDENLLRWAREKGYAA